MQWKNIQHTRTEIVCVIPPYEVGITNEGYVRLVFCLFSLCSAKSIKLLCILELGRDE